MITESVLTALVINEDIQDEILAFIWGHPGCILAGEIFDQFGETQEVAQTVAYLLITHYLERKPGGNLYVNFMPPGGS
jgi:hypothetical protein